MENWDIELTFKNEKFRNWQNLLNILIYFLKYLIIFLKIIFKSELSTIRGEFFAG